MLKMRRSTQEEAEQVNLFKVNASSSTYSFFNKENLVGVAVYQKCNGMYGEYISIGLIEALKKGYGNKIIQTLFEEYSTIQTIVGSYVIESGAFWKSIGAKNDDGTQIDVESVLFGDTFVLKREDFNEYLRLKQQIIDKS